ncbi:MAG: DUF1501 domain-containing protein, partial [Planctomycetota bacterium]|nr:DUF1501 domain-containing protein [Planctomycetota bacterium]
MSWYSELGRRCFLGQSAQGLGAYALASLMNPQKALTAQEREPLSIDRWRGVIQTPHVPPKAKRVIFLVMAGGASHLETFDPKPKLAEMNGQPMPESFTQGQPIAQLQGKKLTCMAPQHPFKACGESGVEMTEIFPHLSTVADEMCVV